MRRWRKQWASDLYLDRFTHENLELLGAADHSSRRTWLARRTVPRVYDIGKIMRLTGAALGN